MSDLENFLTVKEAAEKMGLPERTVRDLCKAQKLPGSFQTAKGQPWLIPVEAVQQAIDDNILPSKPFYEQRWFLGMTAVLVLVAAIFAILADSDIRDRVYGWFVDIPEPTPAVVVAVTPTFDPNATSTPSPTATSLPFLPEQEDETLIIISKFAVPVGNADSLLYTKIEESIEEQRAKLDLNNVRVEIDRTVIDPELNNDEQIKSATELGNIYNASLIIWGVETEAIIEFNFLNLKEPDFDAANVSVEDFENAKLANPEAYGKFIIEDLPGQLAFLSFFSLGQAEYSRSNFEEAIELIETAVASLPDLNQLNNNELEIDLAYFRLGWLYQTTNKDSLAIVAYDQVIALNPEDAEAFNNRGAAYRNLGEYEQAIADLNHAITLNPEYTDAFLNRGNAYAGSGNYEQAIADLDRAININPNFAIAFNNRGAYYNEIREYEQAIADLDQAIKLNPKMAEAFANRGNSYYSQGEFEQALVDYNTAIILKPDYAVAFYSRGLLYGDLGSYEQAIEEYDQAITLNPEFAEAFTNRGYAYLSLGEIDKALTDLNEAISFKPSLATAYRLRGIVYVNQGAYELAVADFNQAISLDPNESLAIFYRGVIYALQEKNELAIVEFDLAIAIDSEFAEAFFYRGVSYQTLGDYDSALSDFHKYANLEPQSTYAPVWNEICWLGSLLGDVENVASACDKAVNLSTDVLEKATHLDSRGLNKALRGDFEGAISDFQTFVDTFQNIPDWEIFVDKRISWINDLRTNKNPFDAETLEELLNE